MIDYVLDTLATMLGAYWLLGVFIIIVIVVLIAALKFSFEEGFLIMMPLVAGLTPQFGGNMLPNWTILLILVPFALLVSESLMKWYQGGNTSS